MTDMTDDRDREVALNRFWNALINAEQPTEADLAPEEIAVLHHLHRTGTVPLAGLSADAAWPHVLARIEAARAMKEIPMTQTNAATISSPIMLPNGHMAGRVGSLPRVAPVRGAPGWAWGQAATAALLLLTLVMSVAAFAWMRSAPEERSTSLPALMATPSSEAATKTLLTMPLPAAIVPRTGSPNWNLAHFTVPAHTPPAHLVGATWDAAIGACCPGMRFEYVVAGTYTVIPDGPVQVVRADGDGTSQPSAAGTKIALGPGDALLSPSETTFTATNAGATPVELLTAVLTNRWSTTEQIPAAWVEHDQDDAYDLSLADASAITLRLQRATLAPQTSLPPLTDTAGLVAVTLDAEASLGKQMDGGLRNISSAPVTAYILDLEVLEEGGATPATTPAS